MNKRKKVFLMRDRMREKILVDLIKDKIYMKNNMIDITQMKNNIKLTHKKDFIIMKSKDKELTHKKYIKINIK